MLLAVEGGGFFSSSSLGYSKGLTLLLLGKKTEKTPMRVTPYHHHYQLVAHQESDSDFHQSDSGLHLASNKNRITRGCASYLCFGRAAAGLDSPRPLKVGPTHHNPQDALISPESGKVKERVIHLDLHDDDDDEDDDNVNVRNSCLLRSSLKRPARTISVSVSVNNNESESEEGEVKHFQENETNDANLTERRVQWTDVSGGELFMIREFEPSEHSDDEFENGNERSCSCGLM